MASTRLHLDQLGLLFVPEFFSHANSKCPVEQSKAFIQRCQVDTILITVSYKPARVDLKALLSTRKESLLEALNLLPELKAPLSLRGFCLRGFEGFESLGKICIIFAMFMLADSCLSTNSPSESNPPTIQVAQRLQSG